MKLFSPAMHLLVVLILAALARTAEAQPDLAGKLPMPAGYCALDPSDSTDNHLIDESWRRSFRNAGKLLRVAVPCDQRDEMRKNGAGIGDFSFSLVIDTQGDPKLRSSAPGRICSRARSEVGQSTLDNAADVHRRLIAVLPKINKLDEPTTIGAMKDVDAKSCQIVVVERVRPSANMLMALFRPGPLKTLIYVRATTVMHDRVLLFYHVAQVPAGDELAAYDRLTNVMDADLDANFRVGP